MANGNGIWPSWKENRGFALMLGILMAYGIVLIGAQIRLTMLEGSKVGVADRQPSTISVTAEATVLTSPDLATLDLGVTNVGTTAAIAQDANTKTMNSLVAGMKSLGIEAKDLKTTNYNVNPRYDYNQSPAVVEGYEASHTLTVTVRDSELVSKVVAKAGELGATNISSVRYESEDLSVAQAQVREQAIAKAYEQGLAIADAMGARLGGVVSYSELNSPAYPEPYYGYAMDARGGSNAVLPELEPGLNEVVMTVYIDFAIE